MQDKAMISLSGVTKVFYTDDLETHALDGIHLDVGRGEFLSISGPSGCGKSTLLAILGLLDSPTEGKYALVGGHRYAVGQRQLDVLQDRQVADQVEGLEDEANALIPHLRARGRRERRDLVAVERVLALGG